MKIEIIASTKPDYIMPKEEAVKFSGRGAGICYMPDTWDTLASEEEEKTLRRANNTLISGHHSVFGHPTYNLILENIPKILAMILNNEKDYNTSEKSARYTKMQPSEKEKDLYEKWIEIYKSEILKEYPDFEEKRVNKLAQENARYLISIFTPATTMEHRLSFQQLNYIVHWFEDYIENAEDNKFSKKLKPVLKEFIEKMPDVILDDLNSRVKNRSLSIFAQRQREEEFGENYSTNYLVSFSELAQAQRHRTLSYEMTFLKETQYFVPPIIRGKELEKEWLKDISSLEELYPQGMLVQVNERGTIENFVLKCKERLCGAAQLEIMEQTKETMDKYLKAVEQKPVLYNYLLPYAKGARCTFPGWKCTAPCIFGAKNAIKRKI